MDCYNFFLLYKRWIIKIFFIGEIENYLLQWEKEYYENNNEVLQEQVRNKYRELSNK